MSVRSVYNVNSFGLGRTVRLQANERVTVASLTGVENNANITGADVSAGNPIIYTGREHRLSGTAQYDLNA